MKLHVVGAGESLFSIALSYGVSVEQLVADNALTNPNHLVSGQTLVVRAPEEYHIVRSGDTLDSIARANGLSINELYRNNPTLHGDEHIEVGQLLVVSYEQQPPGDLAVLGYSYTSVSPSLLRETLPHMTYLSPFTYRFTTQGALIGPKNETLLLEQAKQYSVKPLLHLSNLDEQGHFLGSISSYLLHDQCLQKKLLDEIGRRLFQTGYQGINVDFQQVFPEDRMPFAAFVRRLSETFNPHGVSVTVAVAAKTDDNQSGAPYEGHDYHALGAAANSVLLRTHEWGYAGSEPTPVAPIDAVERVLDYAITRIPKEKILMGIPNYGYDWTLPYISGITQATCLGNQESIELAYEHCAEISFNELSQSPYYHYIDAQAQEHIVHFEDARSIFAKLTLALRKGIYGVGYWNMMRPFPQNLRILASICRILPN